MDGKDCGVEMRTYLRDTEFTFSNLAEPATVVLLACAILSVLFA